MARIDLDQGAPVAEIAPLAVQGGGGAFALPDHLRDYEDPNDGRRCPAIFKDVDFLS